jgi:hypothetical protein
MDWNQQNSCHSNTSSSIPVLPPEKKGSQGEEKIKDKMEKENEKEVSRNIHRK